MYPSLGPYRPPARSSTARSGTSCRRSVRSRTRQSVTPRSRWTATLPSKAARSSSPCPSRRYPLRTISMAPVRSSSANDRMLSTRTAMASGSRYWVSMIPTDRPDDAPATRPRSMTTTSVRPRFVSCHAVASPSAPAPTTITDRGWALTRVAPARLLADDGPEEPHHDEEPTEQRDQPDPAVRGIGAGVGDQLERDPEEDRPGDEQEGKQELAVRVRDVLLDPLGAALGGHRRPQHDVDHQDDDAGGDPERDRLLEGDEKQLHGRMLADGPTARNGVRGYDVERDPIRSTRPIRRAPRALGGWRLGGPSPARPPAGAAAARSAQRGRVHPRRP